MRKRLMMYEVDFFHPQDALHVYHKIKDCIPETNDLCIAINARNIELLLPIMKTRSFIGRIDFKENQQPKEIEATLRGSLPPFSKLWLSINHKFLKANNGG